MLQKNDVGKDFASVKFQRKNKVLSLKTVTSSIKINEEIIVVDPLLLFQRISLNVEKKEDMKYYLRYELAPYPLSIFDDAGMRKAQKNNFSDNFDRTEEIPSAGNAFNVIDDNFLLYRIQWHQNESTRKILDLYVNYVKGNFSLDSYIVFDALPNERISSIRNTPAVLRKRN